MSATSALKVPVTNDVLKSIYGLMLKCRLMEDRQGKHGSRSEAALAGALVELSEQDWILASSPDSFLSSAGGPTALHTANAGSSQLAIAAGVALASKLRNTNGVVAAFLPAATIAFGASHEALTLAAAQKLPLVIFIETADGAGDVERKSAAYGIPGISVDANDAVAIYRVSKEALHHARVGRGPSLVECLASNLDPVEHMVRYLKKKGTWSEEWKQIVL